MPGDDAPVAGAHDDGRLHEHALAHLQHFGPRGAQVDRNAGNGEDEDHVGDGWPQHIEHHHREQQRGKAHDHVGQPHDHLRGILA
ncbi:hypothetical protein D3C72_2323880 [compost metagenome]